LFDTTPEGGLGVDRQIVGINENNGFEEGAVVGLDVGLGEEFQLFADEFDPLTLCAVDNHDIGFDFMLVALVNLLDELVDDGAFARARRSVEDDVGDLVLLVKIVQLGNDLMVDR